MFKRVCVCERERDSVRERELGAPRGRSGDEGFRNHGAGPIFLFPDDSWRAGETVKVLITRV